MGEGGTLSKLINYHGLEISEDKIAEFCRRWLITQFALFGSVLRKDFGPESDIDVLVTFAAHAEWTLLDHIQMEQELESLFGRGVDVVTRGAVEESKNWIRRRDILVTAQTIYVSR